MNTESSWYRSPYFKGILSAFLIFIVIILYSIEFNYLSNTFNAAKLLLVAFVIGSIAGIYAGSRLKVYGKNSEEKVAYFVIPLLGSILIAPLLVSMTNRLLSFHPVEKETVEFVASQGFGMKRFGVRKDDLMEADGYHLWFLRDGDVVRIKSENQLFAGNVKGDLIQIPVQKGLLGFSFVMPQIGENGE